jgi:hypothetical protein
MTEWMEERLLSLLERFKGRLPAEDYAHVQGMLVHREWGIGLEDLCTQLHEHSIPVEASELETIKDVTARMGLPPSTWSFIDLDERPLATTLSYYVIEPEVAGGLGPHTMMDRSVFPPLVSKLHYQFDGWQGDEIVESFPCFLVTESLSDRLAQGALAGIEFADAEVSVSDQFRDAHPGMVLPRFIWLKVSGEAGKDDFGIGPDSKMVVSERALLVIRATAPQWLDVEPFV